MVIARFSSVAVVIPAFNSARTLERAVASCQNQSLSPDEIIVVDDNSTDDTSSLMRRIQTEDSRIRYIRLRHRTGGQSARLRGIAESASEWIAFLDADDELLPDSIRVRLESAAQCPDDTGLVYGDTYFDAAGETLFRFKELKGQSYAWLCKELSLCPYSCMMVRKNAFDTAGYPDPGFPSWQDDDMALTIGKAFSVWHCGAPVAVMDSMARGITADQRRVAKGCRLMVKKYRRDIVKHHGYVRLMLWKARILRAYLLAFCQENHQKHTDKSKTSQRVLSGARMLYRRVLWYLAQRLTNYLGRHFDHIYA